MNKSECALRRTVFEMGECQDYLYLWTFTLKAVHEVREAARLWRDLLRDGLRPKLGFRGCRVFEMHPGGHGLHVHVVTPDRIDVNLVRVVLRSFPCWGRIDVQRVPSARAVYVAKYISKSACGTCGRSDSAMKGMRLWATFGPVHRVRVKDIDYPTGPVGAEMRVINLCDLGRRFPHVDLTEPRRRCWYLYQFALERLFMNRRESVPLDASDISFSQSASLKEFADYLCGGAA